MLPNESRSVQRLPDLLVLYLASWGPPQVHLMFKGECKQAGGQCYDTQQEAKKHCRP
jgi:hypothetical protein